MEMSLYFKDRCNRHFHCEWFRCCKWAVLGREAFLFQAFAAFKQQVRTSDSVHCLVLGQFGCAHPSSTTHSFPTFVFLVTTSCPKVNWFPASEVKQKNISDQSSLISECSAPFIYIFAPRVCRLLVMQVRLSIHRHGKKKLVGLN